MTVSIILCDFQTDTTLSAQNSCHKTLQKVGISYLLTNS